MGKRVYQDQLIERIDPRGVPYYWIGGPPPSGLAEPGTDFHAVVNRSRGGDADPARPDRAATARSPRGLDVGAGGGAEPPGLEETAKPPEHAPKSPEAQIAEISGPTSTDTT